MSRAVSMLAQDVDQLQNLERLAVTVPSDWECQARVSGGTWPCPNGIPSECRFYFFTDYRNKCVVNYCDTTGSEDDPYYHCCDYLHLEGLGNAPLGSTIDNEGDIDEGDGGGSIGLQDMSDCTSETTLLGSSEPWGFTSWWAEDASRAAGGVGTTQTHLINFKITRYEIGPDFGLQLYSTSGDVVLVRPTGETSFKPLGAEVAIPTNDNVTFVPPTASGSVAGVRRLGEKSESLLAHWKREEEEYHRTRLAGACHPMHGCKALPKMSKAANAKIVSQDAMVSAVVDVHSDSRGRRRRLRRGGNMGSIGQAYRTGGISLNRAGNT